MVKRASISLILVVLIMSLSGISSGQIQQEKFVWVVEAVSVSEGEQSSIASEDQIQKREMLLTLKEEFNLVGKRPLEI